MQMKTANKKKEASKNNEVVHEAQWKACSLESIVYDAIIVTVATIIVCVLFFSLPYCRCCGRWEESGKKWVKSKKKAKMTTEWVMKMTE